MRSPKTTNRRSGHAKILAGRQHRSPAERRAEGKALRDAVAREDHGGWRSPKNRRDPVDLLLESNEDRMLELDDGNFNSKRAFTFLLLFFSLAETGVQSQAPLLTLPVQ